MYFVLSNCYEQYKLQYAFPRETWELEGTSVTHVKRGTRNIVEENNNVIIEFKEKYI